ncbi:hypothetical protein RSW44_24980, partial [Escherichia coli]|uniref:hypothetical protein n=1 Tax=Escherichia coli TaxID=562 RepID=UPI0028DFF73E
MWWLILADACGMASLFSPMKIPSCRQRNRPFLSGKNTYALPAKKWKTGGELILFSSEKCRFRGGN